jgi:putative heme degradation protein
MTSKADGVKNAIRDAVRESDAGLRMNELKLAVSVSDADDVFVEVGIDSDRSRRKTAHIVTAAAEGVLQATDPDGVTHGTDGGFTEQATGGEKVVTVVSDRIYRVEVADEWRGLPSPKLSARVTTTIEVV